MLRKIVIAVKMLSDAQKERLAQAVEKYGFKAVFAASEEKALSEARDAEIVFSSYPSLAKNAPDLKWFCTPYAGVEEYTRPGAFLSSDAILTNSSGAYGVTISEHVIMVALEILRRRKEYTERVSRKEWDRELPVRSVLGSRITMLGTGDIGQECAKRFRAFCPASIHGINKRGKNPDHIFDEITVIDKLDSVLPDTDILVMSLPGTDSTKHILDKNRLSMMPDNSVIINVGRGSCVDEEALVCELGSGRLFAALDVFENEPIPRDSALWDCPNLLITPHIAGNLTLQYTRDRVTEMFIEDLGRYSTGVELLHRVDLKSGY